MREDREKLVFSLRLSWFLIGRFCSSHCIVETSISIQSAQKLPVPPCQEILSCKSQSWPSVLEWKEVTKVRFVCCCWSQAPQPQFLLRLRVWSVSFLSPPGHRQASRGRRRAGVGLPTGPGWRRTGCSARRSRRDSWKGRQGWGTGYTGAPGKVPSVAPSVWQVRARLPHKRPRGSSLDFEIEGGGTLMAQQIGGNLWGQVLVLNHLVLQLHFVVFKLLSNFLFLSMNLTL